MKPDAQTLTVEQLRELVLDCGALPDHIRAAMLSLLGTIRQAADYTRCPAPSLAAGDDLTGPPMDSLASAVAGFPDGSNRVRGCAIRLLFE